MIRGTADRDTTLFGRQPEIGALHQLLSQTRAGAGGAVVLWGEPGIGKSALLRHLQDHAADFLRLHHQSTPPERDLPFAGLHGLLRPAAEHIDSLSSAQSTALRNAFGDGPEPTNLLPIADAVLSVLCRLAEKQPVLVVVDDGQWFDEPSALCLGIVARRIRTHPVMVVLADHSHPAARAWDGLPDIRVESLADVSARQLFAMTAPHADDATIRRAVEEGGGNPLALLELAAGDLEDVEPNLGRVRVGPRLRRTFRAGIDALSPAAQLLAVLAAASELGDRLTMQRACFASGPNETAWDTAVEELTNAGLLSVSATRLAFRHPLVRRAVYEGAGTTARRQAHLALAAVMPDDGDERPRHLAAAVDGRDETVAKLLEQSATRSQLRGDTTLAAQSFQCAAELSPDPVDASQRLADAARASWNAGWAAAAERLLDDAERLTPGTHVAHRSKGLRGVLEIARGVPERAHHYLTTDMEAAPNPPTALALGTMAMLAGWAAARADLQADAAQRLLGLDIADRGELSTAMLWWSDDNTETVAADFDDVMSRARTTPLRLLPPTPLALAWGLDGPISDVLLRRVPRLRRRRCARTELAVALAETAMVHLLTGRWAEAESAASEGIQLAEDVGAHHLASACRSCLGWLAAARGDEGLVSEATDRVLQTALSHSMRALSASAYWARGMGLLFRQRPEEALDNLVRLAESGHAAAHPTFALLAAVDTVEAAVHVGRDDVARDRAASLAAWAHRTGAPWAQSSAHIARGLLGGPDAEEEFRAALDVPGAAARPLLHARAQLFYGEWLRRARRRTDARAQLQAAFETFERLGAEPLRRRAQREQCLTDPPGRRASATAPAANVLTAQEQRVALLAAQQLTNREIATRLRISHRTVGHHLGNVFAKLGVTARTELRDSLRDSRPA